MFSSTYDDPADPALVHMSKDSMFRQLILFGALSFNLIYICVFLVFERRECIALNALNSVLFLYDVVRQPGKINL
jgi:hypothetical protein